MSKDSTTNILLVAITLCLVCSVIVSTAAVKLRPQQEMNKILDQKINILKVSGLWQDGADIESLFSSIDTRIINLDTGEVTDEIDVATFDQRKASKIAELSIKLDDDVDVANINRRSNFAKIFLVKNDNKIDRYVFPVHGYGLWSTLYGYVTLEKDMNTIYALKFYDHRETPGLGGEVDNIKWQSSWKGKKLFDADGQLALKIIKGSVVPGNAEESYQVDGLSGATLTSDGVTNMFHFWMGELGFEKFMNKVRAGEVL
ncbi:MAG: Na(+)-translocating NADH-quinone reductase subunit C [Gammaproteobacteria bacterium]|nr:Na(+)-translocating NADH-quinone reductase subunit C [Gammaproteobacteria bacterium]